MKLAVLFSGGKDCCLALRKVLSGGHDVVYLLSVFPKNEDSFMFHKPFLDLLKRQAEGLGIELVVENSDGEREAELEDLGRLIGRVRNDVEGIVVGGIASGYQGERIKKICDKFGLEFVAPLWGYSPEEVWRDLLDGGFKVVMTRVACDGLGKGWVGRVIDRDAFEELKVLADRYKFRIDFEGGEAESAVLFMPEFGREIEIGFEVASEGECRHFLRGLRVK